MYGYTIKCNVYVKEGMQTRAPSSCKIYIQLNPIYIMGPECFKHFTFKVHLLALLLIKLLFYNYAPESSMEGLCNRPVLNMLKIVSIILLRISQNFHEFFFVLSLLFQKNTCIRNTSFKIAEVMKLNPWSWLQTVNKVR